MNLDLEQIYDGSGDKGENSAPKTPLSVIKDIYQNDKVVNKPYDSPNTTSNVYVPDYEGYTNRGVHQNVRNIDIERGQGQSAWDKWGNFVTRVAGKIVTGVIEGISYIPEIFTPGSDYSNAGTEAAQSANAWLDKNFPIYRKSEGVFGSPTDLGWWLQNGEGLVTSVASFALEGIGFAKLFGAVGKAAKIGSTLEKGIGLLSDAATASKAVRLGEQTLTAGMMAYTEGAMSGKRVYDEVYQTQFDKFQAQGMDLSEAHDKAKKIAAESASTTVQLNTVINTGMNLLGGVSQFFNHDKNAVIETARRVFAQQSGESTAQWMTRLATETGNRYARELTGYIEGQGKKVLLQKALKRGREGMAEGIEELTNQFAERTGIEEGKEGKTYNIINQFGQLSKYFDRTMDEEGALNFMMGAIAGPAQQVLTHHIPLHKVDVGVRTNENGEMINSKGEVVTDEKEAAREYAKGAFGMNRVTAFQSRQLQGIKFFDNIRSKIEADVQNISNIETQMKEAASKGDFIKAEELKEDYFHLMNKNSVALGFSEGLKETYRSLSRVDNSVSDKDRRLQEVAEIEQQIETAKSNGEDTTNLEQALEAKNQEVEKASDKTQAQLLGFTDSKENNDYKEKAEKAIQTLTQLQKIHDDIQKKYGQDTTNLEQAHVADFIFDRTANLYLMKERRKELQKELNDIDAIDVTTEYTAQVNEEKRYNREYTRLLNQFEQVDTAIGILTEHQKNPSTKGERLLSKYGALNPTEKSEAQATSEVLEKLKADREKKYKQLTELETTLLGTEGYKSFIEKGGKTYKDYVDYLVKNYSENQKHTAISNAINQLDLQIESHQHFLSELEKAPTLSKIHKSTANFFQELNKKRNEQELKKIQEKVEKLENTKRIAELRASRLLALREKYKQELEDLNKEMESKKLQLEKLIHDLKYFRARPKSETAEQTIQRRTDWTRNKENLEYEIQEVDEKRKQILESVVNIDDKLNEVNTGIPVDEDQFVDEEEIDNAQKNEEITEVPNSDLENELSEPENERKPIAPSTATSTYYSILESLSTEAQEEIENQRQKIITGQENFSFNLLQVEEQLGLIPSNMRLPILVAMRDFIMEQQGEIAEATDIVEIIDNEEVELPTPPDVTTQDTEVFDTELDNDGQEIEAPSAEALFEDSKEFVGNKQTNPATSIANRDLKFSFGVNEKGDYVKKGKPELEEKPNYELVNPDGAKPGTELIFEVDLDYRGTVIDYDGDIEGKDPQNPETIETYLDENRKIILTEDYVGNVPIKVSKKDGTLIGYIHRNQWIAATRNDVSGPERFANTVDVIDGKPGNVQKEIELNISQRLQIATAFNRGQTKVNGVITEKRAGALVSLPGYDTASKHLKDVELGIVNKGQILGVNTTVTLNKEIQDKEGSPVSTHNMVVAMIPRADGTFTHTILKSQNLMDEKSDAFDAISRLTELFLAPGTDKNKREVDEIKTHTGFDVSTVEGYRNYIIQYYTHFTTMKSALNSSKVKSIIDTVSGVPTILLKSQLGISDPVKATLNSKGELSQEFKAALKELLSNRYKTVSLTTDKVKGVNSQDNFNYMEYRKGEWKLNPKHQGKETVTYNDYILPYLQTNLTFAKGPNKDGSTPTMSAGGRKVNRFIYDVNPIVKFELDKTVSEPKQELLDMALPDTTALYEGDNLLSDLGIEDLSPALTVGTINSTPITLEYLENLFNSTPTTSRNGITPLNYYGKSQKLGQKYLPEGYNPFKECN